MRALQLAFARELAEPSSVYRVVDTTLVPAMVRVRASRKGLFCGQATFGRSASKTEWVYGFKVALVVAILINLEARNELPEGGRSE